jgi:hypothetical protein
MHPQVDRLDDVRVGAVHELARHHCLISSG